MLSGVEFTHTPTPYPEDLTMPSHTATGWPAT